MKTYPIFISSKFMEGHPHKGQPTNFKEKILQNEKVHTIRKNYPYWKQRIDQIIKKQGVLSIREWEGKAYYSRALEFKQLTESGYEILNKIDGIWHVGQSQNTISSFQLATQDGLSIWEFDHWFPLDNYQSLIIIHFTKYRYTIYKNEDVPLKQPSINNPVQTSLTFSFEETKPIRPKQPFKFNREY